MVVAGQLLRFLLRHEQRVRFWKNAALAKTSKHVESIAD
jgi:hypothetical protein